MKAKLPMMIQDGLVMQKGLTTFVENKIFENEPYFIDGPVTERVAILDFDPVSGALLPPVPFIKPDEDTTTGFYQVQVPVPGGDVPTPEFIRVSVLATILRTLELAENEYALGRRIEWAFRAPQLLVVPRAGEMANAHYHRDSHSLQLYYFIADDGHTVHTALSRDIVAHETAHAIVDGIAPDLLDAWTPQSIALHEAIADIMAVLMAMDSRTLAQRVLELTDGNPHLGSTPFHRIAEEFGQARQIGHSLRDLDEMVRLGEIDSSEPHRLSQVLSSALYEVFTRIFEDLRGELVAQARQAGEAFSDPEFSKSGEALARSASQLARMCFRAFDYLPPGDITFHDYGQALITSDKLAFPAENADKHRGFIREAFKQNGITVRLNELDTPVNRRLKLRKPVNLNDVVESDWAAYEFANRSEVRRLLSIPREVKSFTIRPRMRTTKKIMNETELQHDIVFKVSWDHIEANNVGQGLPKQRRVRAGTTLVLAADSGAGEENILLVRARLTNRLSLRQTSERDQMMLYLIRRGLLQVEESSTSNGEDLSTIRAIVRNNDVLTIARTGHLLHIAGR